MKKLALITIFFISAFYGSSQNIDSLLSIPQTLELKISTPQPRLKEKFQLSLDINYIRAHIFKSEIGKFEFAEDIGNTDQNLMVLNVTSTKAGKNQIGPLEFNINGTKYSTTKIEYEVIEALPNIDKGIWFRKVFTSDSTFCIIIEQRIPAMEKKTIKSNNSFTLSTEPEFNQIAKFKDSYSISGLSGLDSRSYTEFGSIYDNSGTQKQFMFGYSIYYFRIVDKKIKIKITKDKFENLPGDYKFDDIIIQ
jgi:hypothetical protein